MSETRIAAPVLVAGVIFAVTFALGLGLAFVYPESGSIVVSTARDQVFSVLQDDNPATLSVKIFLNNLQTSLLLFFGGAALGFVTIFILGVNGVVTGTVVGVVLQQKSVWYVLASIAPHGVFEIPAFLLAGGLGLLLGEALLREWREGSGAAPRARRLGLVFIRVVVPLLAVAACVEAFITPALVHVIF
ncbi:MAG: stage II sporulation protein M [Methanomicrobiales archaeon]